MAVSLEFFVFRSFAGQPPRGQSVAESSPFSIQGVLQVLRFGELGVALEGKFIEKQIIRTGKFLTQ